MAARTKAAAKRPLRLEWIEAGSLGDNPNNWRRHPDAQMRGISDVLNDPEIGWAGALLYNEHTKRLIDGHARKRTVSPDTPVPVLIGRWTEEAEKKILLTHDPLAAMAVTDTEALAALRDGVTFQSEDLTALLDGLAGKIENAETVRALVEDGEIPDKEIKRRVKRGEIWILGDHRLMCGDATNPKDVAKLMDRQKANMVLTDPPFGVAYTGKTAEALKVANDHKRDDDLLRLLKGAFRAAAQHATPTAAWYIFHATSTRRDFEAAMDAAGLVECQYLTWVKQHMVLGHADYQWMTEPIFYACRAGHRPTWHGDRTQTSVWRVAMRDEDQQRTVSVAGGIRLSDGNGNELYITDRAPKAKKTRLYRLKKNETIAITGRAPTASDVWEVDRPSRSVDHATTKPTELAMIPIENSTPPAGIVLDMFAGAGFTLLAAERLGRQARVMDIDPRNASVMVSRWEAMTGRTAERADK